MNYKIIVTGFLLSACMHLGFSQVDSLEKMQIDTHAHKTIIDKTLSLFEYDFGRVSLALYPSASLDPASGLSIGAMPVIIIKPKPQSKNMQAASMVNYFAYSSRNWFNARIDLLLYTSQSGNEIKFVTNYVSAPDHFYGIQQTERNHNPTPFTIQEFKTRGNYAVRLPYNIFAGVMVDVAHTKISDIKIITQKNSFLAGVGPFFSYDSRNHVNYPTKGEYISLNVTHFPQFQADNYKFTSLEFDGRKYMSLYKDIIFACNFYSAAAYGTMPFYYLHQLGGRNKMRGISNKFMYINTHTTFVQAEIRKHIWGRFGAVAFAAAGNAYSSLRTVNMAHTKYVYGVGLRFLTNEDEKLNLRIDYGRGPAHDSGVYITMRESF
ncbi:MAG TPA: BamA/TamA family outer membrane protein [Bacteroidales bacterium]|nr:BamA/TamA family outer membrane protein [Bacteroidales bacterium]